MRIYINGDEAPIDVDSIAIGDEHGTLFGVMHSEVSDALIVITGKDSIATVRRNRPKALNGRALTMMDVWRDDL